MLNYKDSSHYVDWQGYRYSKYIYFIIVSSFIHVCLKLLGFKQLTKVLLFFFPMGKNLYLLENKEDIRALKKLINQYFKRIKKSKYLIANCLSTSITIWLILRKQGLNTYLVIGTRKEKMTFKAHAWVEYNNYPLNDNFHIREKYFTFEHKFLNI